MPRYTCRGHEPRFGDEILDVMPVPCRIIDATGRDLTGLYLFFADTETGDIGRYARENGRFVFGLDDGIVELWDRYPAPLTVHPCEPASAV